MSMHECNKGKRQGIALLNYFPINRSACRATTPLPSTGALKQCKTTWRRGGGTHSRGPCQEKRGTLGWRPLWSPGTRACLHPLRCPPACVCSDTHMNCIVGTRSGDGRGRTAGRECPRRLMGDSLCDEAWGAPHRRDSWAIPTACKSHYITWHCGRMRGASEGLSCVHIWGPTMSTSNGFFVPMQGARRSASPPPVTATLLSTKWAPLARAAGTGGATPPVHPSTWDLAVGSKIQKWQHPITHTIPPPPPLTPRRCYCTLRQYICEHIGSLCVGVDDGTGGAVEAIKAFTHATTVVANACTARKNMCTCVCECGREGHSPLLLQSTWQRLPVVPAPATAPLCALPVQFVSFTVVSGSSPDGQCPVHDNCHTET